MGDLVKKKIQTTLDTSSIRIGEFLGLLKVLSPEVLDETLLVAQDLEVPVGRATVLRGLITNDELSNLVHLHGLVKNRLITLEEAKDAFFMSRREQWPIKEALIALGCPVGDGTMVRIGELLIESERVSEEDLDTSLILQGLCGLPLGRILTIDVRIPETVVSEALSLQNEIRDRRRSYREAINRLKKLHIDNREFAGRKRLLINRQQVDDDSQPALLLKDLLLSGGIIRENDLTPAEHFASANRLLTQDVLRSFDWIDRELISAAAGLAGFVRDGYLSKEEAISILKALKSPEETMEILPVLSPGAGKSKSMTLYQLLVTSGFLTAEGIRSTIRSLMSDAILFEDVLGMPKASFSEKTEVKRAIIKSILDSAALEKALGGIQKEDRRVVSYARDLVSLISFGVVSVDQAILSLARLRYDMGERPVSKE